MNKYLYGIEWEHFGDISGIYVTKHHIREKGYRYFSTHNNGLSKKKTIFESLANITKKILDDHNMEDSRYLITKEEQAEWSWHHIVEGNHLEPLFTTADFMFKYNREWPTVLIHTETEHGLLNSCFRSRWVLNSALKGTSAPYPLIGTERTAYLRILTKEYQHAYTGNPLFRKVAENVLYYVR